MRELKAQPLRPGRIAGAYPLIQAAMPGVSLADWTAYARARLGLDERASTGILAIISEQGYIAGLSSYRVGTSLRHGLSLTADHFVALDLFGREAVVRALAEAVEAMARAQDCAAVHTIVHERDGEEHRSHVLPILADRGHRVEAVLLCKDLLHEAQGKKRQR